MPARVLYLHHVSALAGAEQSLLLLLRHLDRRRVTPLFAGPDRGPFPEALAALGVPVAPVGFGALRDARALVAAIRRVRRLVREQRVDLVHANAPRTNVPGAIAARLAGVPVVWHARNLVYEGTWDVDRILGALPARIVCNADAIRARFAASRAWPKTVTILNAVDTTEFHPGVPREPFRDELGVAPSEVLVGIVGRIGLGKGHEHFVEAAVRLLDASVRARFAVVGDPLFAEDAWRTEMLQRRVKDAGHDQRIVFTGFRQDVPRVMRALDVLVLASDAEPCGRVLFEAMACGTAIVATRSGGTPEIVRDGAEGLLVPPRDPGALAGALLALVDDPALRTRLGEHGAVRARTEFTVERHVTKTREVYEGVLARR